MKKTIFIFLAILVVFITTSCSGSVVPTPSPVTNNPYSFSLPSLDGNVYSLSDFEGRVVVLYYFKLNCSYCSQLLPTVLQLSKEYEDVVFLIVNYRDSISEITPYISQYQVDIPVLLDSDGKYAAKLGIYAFPTTVIFNPDGSLDSKIIGAVPEAKLRQKIDAAITN